MSLSGGAGGDTFVIEGTRARNVVVDFEIHKTGEKIDVSMLGYHGLQELIATGVQSGLNSLFDFGGNRTLLILNTRLVEFTTDDFVFA